MRPGDGLHSTNQMRPRLTPAVTIRVVAAALAFFVVATPARAQPLTGSSYLLLKLGAFSPTRSDFDGFGPGIDGELGLGYQLIRNVAVEVAVGSYRSKKARMLDPASGLTVPDDETLSVVPVTGTVRMVLPLGRAEISALAGSGLYFARRKGRPVSLADASTPEAPVRLVTVPVSSSDRTLGVHVGAGFGFYVAPRVLLGADLRYVFARARLFDTPAHIDGLRLDAILECRF